VSFFFDDILGANDFGGREGKWVEAELLESVFTTLAYLFKYLLKQILEFLPQVPSFFLLLLLLIFFLLYTYVIYLSV